MMVINPFFWGFRYPLQGFIRISCRTISHIACFDHGTWTTYCSIDPGQICQLLLKFEGEGMAGIPSNLFQLRSKATAGPWTAADLRCVGYYPHCIVLESLNLSLINIKNAAKRQKIQVETADAFTTTQFHHPIIFQSCSNQLSWSSIIPTFPRSLASRTVPDSPAASGAAFSVPEAPLANQNSWE